PLEGDAVGAFETQQPGEVALVGAGIGRKQFQHARLVQDGRVLHVRFFVQCLYSPASSGTLDFLLSLAAAFFLVAVLAAAFLGAAFSFLGFVSALPDFSAFGAFSAFAGFAAALAFFFFLPPPLARRSAI